MRQIATSKRWDRKVGLFVLSAGIAVWLSGDAVTAQPVVSNAVGAGLRASLEQLAEIDDDARKAFDTTAAKTSASVLQSGDTVFVAYETADGDIVSRQNVDSAWSPPVLVTTNAPRRDGERWDMPRLVAGPDESVWIAYRSVVRRRVFFHRWLGQDWGPRIDGRGIFRVRPSASGVSDEELRPIAGFVVEGSRVRDAIEMRLTSSDKPPVSRIHSIPVSTLKAAPGEGVIFIDTRDVSRTSGLNWQAEFPDRHPDNPLLSPPDNPRGSGRQAGLQPRHGATRRRPIPHVVQRHRIRFAHHSRAAGRKLAAIHACLLRRE